jgi:hypothetical protein
MSAEGITFLIVAGSVALVALALSGLRIAQEYERAVVFLLGRYHSIRGPGLYYNIPLLEWQRKVDMPTVTVNVQMISEVGAEQNTTTIVMMPSEFVTLAKGGQRLPEPRARARPGDVVTRRAHQPEAPARGRPRAGASGWSPSLALRAGVPHGFFGRLVGSNGASSLFPSRQPRGMLPDTLTGPPPGGGPPFARPGRRRFRVFLQGG